MGRMGFRRAAPPVVEECSNILENIDPLGAQVVFGEPVNFKWNGPGCSEYEWLQYELCFKNVANSAEYYCIGVIPASNEKTLSREDWLSIHEAMDTKNAVGGADMYWFITSVFGDSFYGENLYTDSWPFSYSK